MAQIDFGIIKPELAGSFGAGFRASQQEREAREANALNLKIKKEELAAFQQDRQKLLEFGDAMSKLGKDPNPRRIASVLLNSRIPDQIKLGTELAKQVDEHDKIAQIYGLPRSDDLFPSAPATPAAPVMPGTLGSGTFGMMPEPMAAPAQAPANALMPMAAPAQAPANALAPTGRPLTTEERLNALSVVGTPAALRLAALTQQQLNRETRENQPSGRRFIHVGRGQVFDTLTEQFVQAPGVSTAASSRAASGAAKEAAAPQAKPMTELQQQKVNKERVDELQGVKAAKSTADELEKLTDELVGNPAKKIPQHPGYQRIIGFESKIPFTLPGGDAAKAEQKLETFKGKISTFGRQLASQYGKLGNMAVQEWKIVSDSVQNINPAAGNLDEQMRDVVRQARDFEKSMQEKYNALYGDEGQQPATPAQPATKAPRTVTRTGKIDGRRVVQYSDGSVEYAD